jgi:hypothetical protein
VHLFRNFNLDWCWLGFSFTPLSGSVLWQRVPLELGFIYGGDRPIKIADDLDFVDY